MILLRKCMYLIVFLLILYITHAQDIVEDTPLTKTPQFWLAIIGLNIAIIAMVSFLIVRLVSREKTPSIPFKDYWDKYFKITTYNQKRDYLSFLGKSLMFTIPFYSLLVWRYTQYNKYLIILFIVGYIILNYVYFRHYKKPNIQASVTFIKNKDISQMGERDFISKTEGRDYIPKTK